MYAGYLKLPRAERPAYLRVCVRAALSAHRELPGDFEAARPDLRPELWPRVEIETQRLRGLLDDGGGVDPPHVPLGGHVLACVAYDWPESTQSISDEDLEKRRVTPYEAMEAATQNLAAATRAYSKTSDQLPVRVAGRVRSGQVGWPTRLEELP
jgi:hypothetical protein